MSSGTSSYIFFLRYYLFRYDIDLANTVKVRKIDEVDQEVVHAIMDISNLFRILVSNHYMPEFDYINTQFSFSTVFYTTFYTYCCCECAFQHEYIDYISENGTIDEPVYNKIVRCIEDGQCPHVADVPPNYICESSVNAIHIAAAVGTVEAVEYQVDQRGLRYLPTGIFGLESCFIAALKKSYTCLEIYVDDLYRIKCPSLNGSKILYGYRSKKNRKIVKIKQTSLLAYCVEKKDIRLVKCVLRHFITFNDTHRAYELAFKHRLFDIQEALLKYDRDNLEYRRARFNARWEWGSNCAILPIVCNQPEILDTVLKLASLALKLNCKFNNLLAGVCLVLKRTACYDILLQHGVHNGVAELDIQMEVKHLLFLYTFYKEFRQEIFSILSRKKNISQAINTPIVDSKSAFHAKSLMGPLQSYIDENKTLDAQVVKIMLELGADVDVIDIYGNTALTHLLKEKWYRSHCDGFREVLELLIKQNPKQYMNISVVSLGLQQDVYMKAKWKTDFTSLPGKYILDGKPHSCFGHDGVNSFALNFTGPLLIECGFPCSAKILKEALKNTLDPSEKDYLKKCLKEPRSLKLKCRDVLRRTFCGQQLRRFLDVSYLPTRIKDFILLKSTLVINDQS